MAAAHTSAGVPPISSPVCARSLSSVARSLCTCAAGAQCVSLCPLLAPRPDAGRAEKRTGGARSTEFGGAVQLRNSAPAAAGQGCACRARRVAKGGRSGTTHGGQRARPNDRAVRPLGRWTAESRAWGMQQRISPGSAAGDWGPFADLSGRGGEGRGNSEAGFRVGGVCPAREGGGRTAVRGSVGRVAPRRPTCHGGQGRKAAGFAVPGAGGADGRRGGGAVEPDRTCATHGVFPPRSNERSVAPRVPLRRAVRREDGLREITPEVSEIQDSPDFPWFR